MMLDEGVGADVATGAPIAGGGGGTRLVFLNQTTRAIPGIEIEPERIKERTTLNILKRESHGDSLKKAV